MFIVAAARPSSSPPALSALLVASFRHGIPDFLSLMAPVLVNKNFNRSPSHQHIPSAPFVYGKKIHYLHAVLKPGLKYDVNSLLRGPGGNDDVSGTGLLHHLYVLHVRMLTQCHAIA